MMAVALEQQATFHFCHNPHAASVLKGLQELRSDNKLIDVILCVSGKEIPCHRNVLAACSEYFRAMFCNGHLESMEHKVTIHEVSSDILHLLVDYAYSSRITITESNAAKILEGANFFQIQPVYDACVKFMSKNLSAKNCLQIVHISNMLSCSDLEKKAQVCVMKEFKAVSKTPEFLCLTKDQLIAFISSEDLSAPEEAVYEAVMTWINHDTRKRKEEMRELMELVRFPFMDKIYFMDNVENDKAIQKCCPEIITETLKYQLFPGEVQSPRTRPRRASILREAVVVVGGIEKEGPGDLFKLRASSNSITMTDSTEPSPSSWVSVSSINLNTKVGFAMAVLGTSEIILTSGKQVMLYQEELNSWSNLAPKNVEQYHHKLAVLDGKVYSIGGRRPTRPRFALADVEVYDQSQHKWTAGVSLPQPRYTHAVAVVDGSIYLIGGNNAASKPTATVYCFTPGDSHWQPQRDMPKATGFITASVLNGKVYVAGVRSKVLCFEPSDRGGSWSVVASTGVGPLCGMTVFRGKVYIYGGHCTDDGYGWGYGSTAVCCLDPETKSLIHVGDMARGLFGHGCVTILKCC